MKLVKNDLGQEQVVMAEVLIPDQVNVYGDFHTMESIKQFAYSFAESGFGIDINHDNIDSTGSLLVVESFLVRESDKDFPIEGSWVVGILVRDDEIWQDILDGELNGLSYESIVKFVKVIIDVDIPSEVTGVTEPDIYDGHVHKYWVKLDDDGRVVSGGTDEVDDHYHLISLHTSTELTRSHRHIFNIISGKSDNIA
ncbi:MAG: hypothetical protein DRQ47_00295 [Gammaproteobacteria bacterium]|nr:MAG: hypothetical protein DRQ47_00295 [Gammaproteobacteria bacterium]